MRVMVVEEGEIRHDRAVVYIITERATCSFDPSRRAYLVTRETKTVRSGLDEILLPVNQPTLVEKRSSRRSLEAAEGEM